jgi:hypothetical protein
LFLTINPKALVIFAFEIQVLAKAVPAIVLPVTDILFTIVIGIGTYRYIE